MSIRLDARLITTEGHAEIVIEFYGDQEYIYFIGSEMIISMSYKRKTKLIYHPYYGGGYKN